MTLKVVKALADSKTETGKVSEIKGKGESRRREERETLQYNGSQESAQQSKVFRVYCGSQGLR